MPLCPNKAKCACAPMASVFVSCSGARAQIIRQFRKHGQKSKCRRPYLISARLPLESRNQLSEIQTNRETNRTGVTVKLGRPIGL